MTAGDAAPDGGTGPAPRRWARALRLARAVYVAAALVLLVVVVARQGDDVRDLVASARPGVLLLCLLASIGQLALTSAVWASGLRALGSPVPWTASLVATAVSAPARYLPGGVWYAVGRGAVLRARGVPAAPLVAVAVVETALVPVLGFALGGVLLVATGESLLGALSPAVLVTAVLLLCAVSPPVVNALLRLRRPGTERAAPPQLTWPGLLRVALWVLVFWSWSAGVFALYVAAFPGAADASPVTVAGAFMVAWGIGWLAVFAPQGLGVFEAAVVLLLHGGQPGLAVVLAGYRVLVLVRDVLAGTAAAALTRRADAVLSAG